MSSAIAVPDALRNKAHSIGLDLPETVTSDYAEGLREAFDLADTVLKSEYFVRYWLITTSVALGARPVVLMHTPSGLADVLDYLRAMKAKSDAQREAAYRNAEG